MDSLCTSISRSRSLKPSLHVAMLNEREPALAVAQCCSSEALNTEQNRKFCGSKLTSDARDPESAG